MLFMYKLYAFHLLKTGLFIILNLAHDTTNNLNVPSLSYCVNGYLRITGARREHSGSVVECWTQDQGAAGLSLTGVTVFCP